MNSTVLIILISLLFSAFFSGMEIAFVSSNKLRFEIGRQKNHLVSSLLTIFYEHPDQYISTILVGNNIALVVYGIEAAHLIKPWLLVFTNNVALIGLAQTLISTFLILLVGEILPKMMFRINANFWMNVFAVPMFFIYVLLYPISLFMRSLSVSLMKLAGVSVEERTTPILGRVDLDYLVQESVDAQPADAQIEHEVKFFQNALDFSKVRLRDCMVPRTEIEAVDYEASIEELQARFVSSGCSKILVFKESMDNIVGYVHQIELFSNPTRWQDRLILAPIVPETMAANKLMNMMLLKKKSLAVVVDEFGGTAGIVTLEDVVEEIFGEIEDEHDTQEYVEKQLDDHTYVLSGRLEIDALNERYGWQLPVSEDYQTLAGCILQTVQAFPKQGEECVVAGYKILILKSSQNKIELVKLIIP